VVRMPEQSAHGRVPEYEAGASAASVIVGTAGTVTTLSESTPSVALPPRSAAARVSEPHAVENTAMAATTSRDRDDRADRADHLGFTNPLCRPAPPRICIVVPGSGT